MAALKTADYLDQAKRAANLTSDAKLAERLKITRAYLSQLRSGVALPGHELMIRIVKVIYPNKGTVQSDMIKFALLHLDAWNAERAMSAPELQQQREELIEFFRKAKRIAAAIVVGVILAGNALPTSGHAAEANCILWKINYTGFPAS